MKKKIGILVDPKERWWEEFSRDVEIAYKKGELRSQSKQGRK